MKRYYIMNSFAEKGFEEVTEEVYISVIGDDETRAYAGQLYKGKITETDVPEELLERVKEVVANRTAYFGAYADQEIGGEEFKNKVAEEVLQ